MVYNMMWLKTFLLDLSGKRENCKVNSEICLLAFIGLAHVVKVMERFAFTNLPTSLQYIKNI